MKSARHELKRTPLYGWHLANKGQMVDFAGWEMPVQYRTGVVREHLGTRRFGGLFDVSHMGRFQIQGSNKLAFLQKVLTNNAQALHPWEAQYTMLGNEQGGALDDAFLYRFGEDDYLLVVNASNRQNDWAHFQDLVSDFEGVSLKDLTEALSLIAVQGPKSKELLERVSGKGIWPEARQNCLGRLEICGVDCYLSRTGYTGEPNSFEIFPPAESVLKLWEGLLEAGQDLHILPVGLGARDTLRLEAGMPLYGHELGTAPDGSEIPIFALSLAPVAVSLSPIKRDFIGRQALTEQWQTLEKQRDGDFSGSAVLPKRIRCLALEGKGVARQGAEVLHQGKTVGVVTSGTSVPFWVFAGEGLEMQLTDEQSRRSIGLAYLEAWIQPETEVAVKVRNKTIQARVVAFHGRSDAPPYFHPLPLGSAGPVAGEAREEALGRLRAVLARSWDNHTWRQEQCMNLIPSEMTPSALVRLSQVADPVGRYAEHKELAAAYDKEIFYYQGCDFIAWVEEQLAREMSDFLGCPLVECRPVSGQMANMTVFSGLVQWRNRANLKREPGRIPCVFTNHIGKGGHLSAQPMGALRDYIAKDPLTEKFNAVNFPVLADNPYCIDLESLGRLLDEYDPELVVFGKSMVLHREPVAEVRAMLEARKKKAVLMYDMAHVLGLIGPHFQEPFQEGADLVTGSTHKTFFGTQRGVIGCGFDQENTPEHELWQTIRRRSFPGMVSNHHLGTLLGLLIAAIEMNAFKDRYQPQVIANAKAFAKGLKACDLEVQGDPGIDYTETHQVVLKVGYARGPEVARDLEDNHIICNYQALPEDEGFTASSGLRLGVSEMTRFGMRESDFEALAQLMADVVLRKKPVAAEVIRLRRRFQELKFCFSGDEITAYQERFLKSLG